MANYVMDAKVYARVSGWLLLAIALFGFAMQLFGPKDPVEGRVLIKGVLSFDLPHTLLHLALAVVAFAVGYWGRVRVARLYAIVFGAVYAALGVAGLFPTFVHRFDASVHIHLESGENLVHLLLGLWGLVVGAFGGVAIEDEPDLPDFR